MIKVKIKLDHPNAKVPVQGNPQAMCFDCYAADINIDQVNSRTIVDLGFKIELPEGYGMRVLPRSNVSKHFYVLGNSVGVIDPDYRGNVMATFIPIPSWTYTGNYSGFSLEPFPYEIGDRCCQVEIYKKETFEFEITDTLSNTERGEGGFGSTGKK